MPDDDFKPRKPDFQINFSDPEGNVNGKDRSRSAGVWLNTSASGVINGQIKMPTVPIGPRAVIYDNRETTEPENSEW